MPALPLPFAKTVRNLIGAAEVKSAPESFTLTDDLAALIFGGAPTNSGISINPASAMRVPAVSAAVQRIAESVALPVKLFARADKSAAPDHPAYRLVHDEANDFTSAAELRTQLTTDALLNDAGGFAFANRVERRVVEFIRLDPASVTVKTDKATGEPIYITGTGQNRRTFAHTEVLHIRAFGGTAPINRAREAIALALVLEQHAARLFGNGARPSGVLSFPNALTPAALSNAITMWMATHGGAANAGKPAVLDNGGKWEANALTSVDAQFEQMRVFQIGEIARAFQVPPTLLFDLTHGTLANTEQMASQFLTLTLRPWLSAWEWAYARVLLTPDERRTHYVEFITDDLLSVDHAVRAQSYAQYRSMGAMTANEVRAGLNLPPLPGGDVLQNPYTTSAANADTPAPDRDAA